MQDDVVDLLDCADIHDERIQGGEPTIPRKTLLTASASGARSSGAAFQEKDLCRLITSKADRHCLMDVKGAIQPAAPRSKSGVMPGDNAERVIAGASKASGARRGGVAASRPLPSGSICAKIDAQTTKSHGRGVDIGNGNAAG